MILIAGASIVALLAIIGWFGQHIEEFSRWALAVVQEPFHILAQGVGEVMAGLRDWIREQMRHRAATHREAPGRAADEDSTPGSALSDAVRFSWNLQYLIGAVFYTAAFAAFAYADFWLIALTLEAFGFEATALSPPHSAALLTAAALIGVPIFWGLILLDLKRLTHLAPAWDRLSAPERRKMARLAWGCISLAMLLALAGGIWRGTVASSFALGQEAAAADRLATGGIQITSPGIEVAQPSTSDQIQPADPLAGAGDPVGSALERAIPGATMGVLPVLVSISGVWSGMGVATLLYYLVVIVTAMGLIPLAVARTGLIIVNAMCNAAFGALGSIVRLLQGLGRGIIEAVRRWYNWLCAGLFKSSRPQVVSPPPGEAGPSAADAPAADFAPAATEATPPAPGSDSDPWAQLSADADPWNTSAV